MAAKLIDLSSAMADLESMLGANVGALLPDNIASALVTRPSWRPIPRLEDRDDIAVARATRLLETSRNFELVVVTDPSFRDGNGAFLVERGGFESFAEWHLAEMGEVVFSSCDVLAWARASGQLWLFHHEGVYSCVDIVRVTH
jgi:hypothetical protein